MKSNRIKSPSARRLDRLSTIPEKNFECHMGVNEKQRIGNRMEVFHGNEIKIHLTSYCRGTQVGKGNLIRSTGPTTRLNC